MSQFSLNTPTGDGQTSPNFVDAVKEYDILDRFRFVTLDSDSEGELTHPEDDESRLDRALVEAHEWLQSAHHKQPKSRDSEQERQTQHNFTPTDVELDHTVVTGKVWTLNR